MLRPMPRNPELFVDPFKMHPPKGLKTSVSAPLQTLAPHSQVGGAQETELRTGRQTQLPSEDVGAKIASMLAAHQELKGECGSEPETPAFKASRVLSRMFNALNMGGKKEEAEKPIHG